MAKRADYIKTEYTLFYENNKIINNNKLFKLIKI